MPIFCSVAFSSQFSSTEKNVFFVLYYQISSFHLYPLPWAIEIVVGLSCTSFRTSRKGQKVIHFLPHGTLRNGCRRSTFPGDSAHWEREQKKEILSPLYLIFELFYALQKQTDCVCGSVYSHSSTSFCISPGSSVFIIHFCIHIYFKPESSKWGWIAELHPFFSHCLHWERFENIAHPFPGCFGDWLSCWLRLLLGEEVKLRKRRLSASCV